MEVRFDHILIRVENLYETVNEFRNMGFKVYYGNTKKDCHHAMIYFDDQTFIEFIDQSKFPHFMTFLVRKKLLNIFGTFFKRIGHYTVSTNRYLDYSFYCSDIEKFYQQVKAKMKVSKLMKLKRVDCFKEKLSWKLFSYDDMELPFIMSDYFPQKHPEKNSTNHFNGIKGINQILITTKSITDYTHKLSKLFNLTIQNDIFQIGSTQIQIEQGQKFKIKTTTLSEANKTFDFSVLSKYGIKIAEPNSGL